jgi:hypothetical protein
MFIMRTNARNTIESTRVAGMTPRVVETVQDRGAHGADLTRGVAVGGDRGAVERLDLRARRLVEEARGAHVVAGRRVERFAEEARVHERLAGASAVERIGVIGGVADDEEVGGERLAVIVDEAAQAILQAAHRQHLAAEHRQRIGQLGIDERGDAGQRAYQRVERLDVAQQLEALLGEVRGERDRVGAVVGGEDRVLDPAENPPSSARCPAAGNRGRAAAIEARVIEDAGR